MTGPVSAAVDVLTAEVRVVMVGNRQVTLSVYRQLDWVPASDMEPWGRVRSARDSDDSTIELIGRSRADGANLVASSVPVPSRFVNMGDAGEYQDYLRFGYRNYQSASRLTVVERGPYIATIDLTSLRAKYAGQGLRNDEVQWANAEAQEAVIAQANHLIDVREAATNLADRMRQLPLIVLAGLK